MPRDVARHRARFELFVPDVRVGGDGVGEGKDRSELLIRHIGHLNAPSSKYRTVRTNREAISFSMARLQ